MADLVRSRHSLFVRITHWIMTLVFLALLVTGLEIVVSHPRFYWGEVGNDNTPTGTMFAPPPTFGQVPALSENSTVPLLASMA